MSDVKTEHDFLALGMDKHGYPCWGKGHTRKMAMNQLTKAAYGACTQITFYKVHPDSWVDEMGDVHHPKNCPPIKLDTA